MSCRVALVLAVLLATSCTPSATAPLAVHGDVAPVQATVISVSDGDTVTVSVDGKLVKVRLLGIDTPETKKPGTPVQCGGPEATAYAHQRLDGQTVSLLGDPTQAPTDRYHRALRYIGLPDYTDYSTDITGAGWARSYVYEHKPTQKQPQIEAAQAAAQAAHRGMWAICPMN